VFDRYTGWRYQPDDRVAGMGDFFNALSKRIFVSATQVRSREELHFCKLPDIFHDVFGHAALLMYEPFSVFLQELGKLGVYYRNNAAKLQYLANLYWYTAEVGLIREEGELRYYGGSIISSTNEFNTVYQSAAAKLNFSVDGVGNTPYNSYAVNNVYYIVDHLTALNESLPLILQQLQKSNPVLEGQFAAANHI
jgi:phenylalanine-4-hydroxylase